MRDELEPLFQQVAQHCRHLRVGYAGRHVGKYIKRIFAKVIATQDLRGLYSYAKAMRSNRV